MGRSIAIVEDEPAIRANYVEALNRFGYQVHGYGSRPDASRAFACACRNSSSSTWAWAMNPRAASTCAASCARNRPTLPIIFLTARDSDFDIISGLRLGADDYLTKDVSLHHLAARISALFRRLDALNKPTSKETVVEHGPLKLEAERMRITWNGVEVPLTVTEFWMVHTLVRFPGHVKNRDQLMREAQVVVDDATITSHIKRIRKKFVAHRCELRRDRNGAWRGVSVEAVAGAEGRKAQSRIDVSCSSPHHCAPCPYASNSCSSRCPRWPCRSRAG